MGHGYLHLGAAERDAIGRGIVQYDRGMPRMCSPM